VNAAEKDTSSGYGTSYTHPSGHPVAHTTPAGVVAAAGIIVVIAFPISALLLLAPLASAFPQLSSLLALPAQKRMG